MIQPLPSVPEFVAFLVSVRGLKNDNSSCVAYKSRYLKLKKYLDIHGWSRSSIQDYITTRTAAGLSPNTINNDIKMLRHLDIYLDTTHMRAIKSRRPPKRAPRYLLEYQIEKLLETHPTRGGKKNRYPPEETDTKYDTFFYFAFVTGCRHGEIQNLKWDDVYPDKIVIRDTKTNEERVIATTNEMYERLHKLPSLRYRSPYVFGSDQGKIDRSSVSIEFRRRLEILGWQNEIKRIHDLRSSTITSMRKNGAKIDDIAEYIGHRNLNTTRGYIGYDMELKRESASYAPYAEEFIDISIADRRIRELCRALTRSKLKWTYLNQEGSLILTVGQE